MRLQDITLAFHGIGARVRRDAIGYGICAICAYRRADPSDLGLGAGAAAGGRSDICPVDRRRRFSCS